MTARSFAATMAGVQCFSDDDLGYLDWLAAHADGFVLNTYRKPTPTYLILHRATCNTISRTSTGGERWTSDYTKFCGSRPELESLARDEVGGDAHPRGRCI